MGLITGGILVSLVTAVVAGALVLVVQKYSPTERHDGYVDAIGMVFAVVGVLYAIVLAFVVLDVWEHMTSARADTYAEATSLIEVYQYAEGQPDDVRAQIQGAVRDYNARVIRDEWPMMALAQPVPLDDWVTLDRIGSLVEETAPGMIATDASVDEYRDVSASVGAISTARQDRLAAASRGLPAVMWFLLIGGGLLTVAFAYLFDIAGTVPQIIFTVGLTMMVVLLLYAVYQLEFPFSRAERIGPDAFDYARLRFDQIRQGG
ncbi:hypothetical protein F4553_004585 [Allocatelliglobosispora scoriae]|uniref:DUF4239 domain-containing protein n=1 Tax=Allocatelliglobosispora scoriae TaxID=643052 RepID=A0A841BUS6_9ACTN|nr:DUF4239 domain-containing protein [Allocatelliglobosispora scoriae]MBB5871206.1 hypothetical protein [Allocatelliglobosispora scoriae]